MGGRAACAAHRHGVGAGGAGPSGTYGALGGGPHLGRTARAGAAPWLCVCAAGRAGGGGGNPRARRAWRRLGAASVDGRRARAAAAGGDDPPNIGPYGPSATGRGSEERRVGKGGGRRGG